MTLGLEAGHWPLVGRDEVLRRTVALLRRRDTSGVVLLGEEGVGKSRLTAEVLEQLRAQGLGVLHAVATAAGASLPFGSLADLLPARLSQAASPFDLVRLAAAELRARAPRQGLVVAVDDAHLLDDPSAALIAHVVRSGAARTLLVVRDLEPAPDALLGLVKDGTCRQMRVEPLGTEELAALCGAVLGGAVEGASLRRLQELAGGNLLHLSELLDAALATGGLRHERGVWRSTATPLSPRRLSHVVQARLERLDDPVRAVVETVALIGTAEVALLERLHGTAAVVDAERARLVATDDDGRRLRARLASPLYAEVLRAGTPRLVARLHRRDFARALAGTGCRRTDDVLRLAHQRLEAGEQPEEEVLLAAADAAAQRFDVHLAVQLASAAARATGSTQARLAAAEALYAAGHRDEAEKVLLALQAEGGAAPVRARVALARAANLIGGFGRAAEAERVIGQARDALAADERRGGPDEQDHEGQHEQHSQLRDELVALGGMLALSQGRSREALREVEPLLARPAPSSGPSRARVRALLVALSAWAQVGQAATTVRAGEELRDQAPDRDLPTVYEAGLVGLCYAYGVLGRLDDAERLARRRYDAALDQRTPDMRTLWALALGQAALARGDLVRADGHLREAQLLLRQDQSLFGVFSLAWCLGCLGETAAVRGDAAGAHTAVEEALSVTPEPCFIISRELARIWLAVVEGSTEAGIRVAYEVADQAAERGLHVAEAAALHQVARLGRAAEVVRRLEEVAAVVDGELTAAHAAHAAACASRDGAALTAVSATYERLGVLLDAAEAAAQATGAWVRAGRSAEASRAAQRSLGLAQRCPGARTPGLHLAVEPQPLTPREREIVGLAARGWTTARIADALVLSARTVDNHLHRAYAKLGVTSRRQLADLGAAGDPART